MSNYDSIKKWRKEIKKQLVKAFGGKCCVCGYDKSMSSLSFHHLDPDKKDFIISSSVSWKRTVEEVKKCVLVCLNCHSEIHHDGLKLPKNSKRFDEKYSKRIKKSKVLYDICPVCGENKPIKNLTCSRKCASKKRNKINWQKYDLKVLYEEIGSFNGVAKHIGNISDVAVKKRMVKENII